MRLALLALQATAAALGSFDLRDVPQTKGCGGSEVDIVVCGRKRVKDIPLDEERYGPRAIRAATRIGTLAASATVSQKAMPDGTTSNRVMFNLKLPF